MAFRDLSEIYANNESQTEILPGLVQKYLDSNEYIAWVETVPTERTSVTVPYIQNYGTVQKGMDCNTSYVSAAISGGNDEFSLIKYGTQYETCLDVIGLGSSFVDQAGEDLLGATKRLSGEIAVDLITGTGSGEVLGLNNLVTNSVAASTVGGAGDIESIWYLFDAVKAKSSKMALVMNSKTKRGVLSAMLGVSHVDNKELKDTSFTVPVFNGAAILVNDACTDGDVFLVNGATDEGVYSTIGANPSNKLGIFNFVDVGMSQDKDNRIYRLNASVSHVRKSRQGLARVTGWIA